MKVAYFLSHPIQYQTPMLREFAAAGLEVITVYGDISTAGAYFDRDYQQVVSWEQPLLEGYPYEVLQAPTWDHWPRKAADLSPFSIHAEINGRNILASTITASCQLVTAVG